MAFQRYVCLSVETKDGDSINIDELKIDFDIEKTDCAEENRAVIRIYNLTSQTSAAVTEADGHVMLKAGYKDESTGTIFTGDILRGWREKSGNDYITTIEAYDGRTARKGGLVTLSYAKGTDALTVAQDLLEAIGLPYKGQDKISGTYAHGYCFIGMASDGLSELLARGGLVFTVQDETLYIAEPDSEIDSTGLTLEEGCDLISLPQILSDKTDTADVAKDAPNRWTFSARLNPQLVPGASVSVESSTLKGDFIIKTARSTGSNMDGDFRTDIEAVAA